MAPIYVIKAIDFYNIGTYNGEKFFEICMKN